MGEVLAVISGKGGTGKTSLCAGVAACLAQAGQRVLCVDADVGLRNLDISLGLSQEPALCFTDVMNGTYPLEKATAHPGFPNLYFLTAPVLRQPEEIDEEQFRLFLEEARSRFDWCLIDAPAGVGAGFRLAVRWADQAMVITGGEPAALRDGASAADALEGISRAEVRLVVNRIKPKFFRRTRFTVDDCMDTVGLPLLGIVPEDETVILSAVKGKSLMQLPVKKNSAAHACRNIANRLMGKKTALLKL